jgi:queuine tRNA-ribosyltransferase/7-cyano-7-deazaguanine tRNA-ribosyltransferase
MLDFQIIKHSKKSLARVGILKTVHGEIETPAFVAVATRAVVKTLSSEDVESAKSQILIANTFHLHLRPGEKIIKQAGGLHTFMNWHRPLMTDSAGFQVFSLGFGKDFPTSKLIKGKLSKKALIKANNQPSSLKITQSGVYFRSPINGETIFIGPRESIKIQKALGADIIFAFDECTSPLADKQYTYLSLERTHFWAEQSLDYFGLDRSSKQSLFGIIQGGKFKDLRQLSAKFIGSLPFAGFGIGGEFGNEKDLMTRMVRLVVKYLPKEKPRHLLGIGYLVDIPMIIKSGIDLFDCTVPTHYARRGIAFTSEGSINLKKSVFLKDNSPLDKKCICSICQNYKKNYIAHLLRAQEITGMKLLTFHNLYFFNVFVEKCREKIKQGKL